MKTPKWWNKMFGSGKPEDLFVAGVIAAQKAFFGEHGVHLPIREERPHQGDGWKSLGLKPPTGTRTWVQTYSNNFGAGFTVHQERIGKAGQFERRAVHVGPDPTRYSKKWGA